MGFILPTAVGAACSYFGSGHGLAAGSVRHSLNDPCAWSTYSDLEVDVAEQRLLVTDADGTVTAVYVHDALAVDGHLDRLGRSVLRRRPGAWSPGRGILGLPADTLRGAGRVYLSFATTPLAPCPLRHDETLAAVFKELTEDFADSENF